MVKKGLRYGVMGKNKWFQKGAFKDGYQFGDITKTIFGTVADVNENINAAVFDATENLIDTAAYGVGVVGGLFNKDFQDDTGKFISQEILRPEKWGKAVTDYFDPIGWVNGLINNGDTEGNSILGENMDGMVQSAAHMAGSKALGAINPVLTPISMGVNSFGSEIEQAYQQDATHLEAGISGAVSVASEILFDKLSNGIKLLKGTNADEAVMKQLSTGISKKLLKSLMNFGIDALEEGFEETLTEITNAVGRKLTYANEKEWKEVLSSEALWNAFIGGVIMSGGANGFGMVNSTGNKADLKTELSKTEEKIVNELYKVKADEASANGVELNDNNKSEIYNSLKQKVIEGRAFANGINKIFEGKDYKEYREAVNSEQKQRSDLNSVIDAIENVPAEQRTIYQNEMLTKAKKQSEFLKYNSRADVLFKKIKDKTQAFVKSGILNDKEAGAQQKRDFFERGVQEETKNALLSKEEDATKNHEGRNNYIVPEEFIDGLWEGSKNSGYNESAKDVEKSQDESVENAEKNGIIEKIVDDTGVPGEYTSSIVWQRRNVPARKVGKGYFGKRTKQYDSRVDSYELKLNPNDESYFLIHADGKPVQFENMKNGVVQDCKLVRGNNSIYYVKEKIPILNKNILQQAKRQSEAANLVGYRVEWLLSDKRAVDQMKQLFYENNLDIIVTYYPE